MTLNHPSSVRVPTVKVGARTFHFPFSSPSATDLTKAREATFVDVLAAYFAAAFEEADAAHAERGWTRVVSRPMALTFEEPLVNVGEDSIERLFNSVMNIRSIGRHDVLDAWADETRRAFGANSPAMRERLLRLVFERLDAKDVLLHALLPASDAALFQRILGTGADVNACDAEGYTPLHRAVSMRGSVRASGASEVFEVLFAAGALLDTVDLDGRTALHLAALRLRSDDVADLLRLGAHPAPLDRDGNTPDHLIGEVISRRGATDDERTAAERIRAMLGASMRSHSSPPQRAPRRYLTV
jgi:hypothetical protein